jgi:hypothetical protein
MRSEAKKKRAAIFLGCSFFSLRAVCGTEGGTTDWNSRTEQRERPKGDRFIAVEWYWNAPLERDLLFFGKLLFSFRKPR